MTILRKSNIISSHLWNCWNKFIGIKLSKLYLVVRMPLPLHPLEMSLYSDWRGPWRATTTLRLPVKRLCVSMWASGELLVRTASGEEYQPRPESAETSCCQRCLTQWICSITTVSSYMSSGHQAQGLAGVCLSPLISVCTLARCCSVALCCFSLVHHPVEKKYVGTRRPLKVLEYKTYILSEQLLVISFLFVEQSLHFNSPCEKPLILPSTLRQI